MDDVPVRYARTGLSVGMVGTAPPRQCGVATFSKDLAHAMLTVDPSVRIRWAAINEATSLHAYGPEVQWRIRQGDLESYRRAAAELNASSVDVVCLQHEFGLYDLDCNRIALVPHGVPPIQAHGRVSMKDHFGVSRRTIITTFGLVDPRKGLESMIEAMAAVRERDPSAL